MHSLDFLADLFLVLGLSGLVTVVFQRLGQPLVLGYLLAGVLLSLRLPFLPFLGNESSIAVLADLGIIFMMFFLGLEFNLRKIREIGPFALVAGLIQIALTFWLGFVAGRAMDWSTPASLLLGAVLCISSTTIIVKSLVDLGKLREDFAQLIIGILLVEDVVAVLILVLLSGWVTTGRADFSETAAALSRVVAFSTGVIGVGLLLVPRFIRWIERRLGGGETLALCSVAVCVGLALLAAHFGFSVALGAFLAGALVAESGHSQKIEERLSAMRDVFLAVFFVTVGLQVDLGELARQTGTAAAVLATLVAGKVLFGAFGAHTAGYDFKTGVQVGLGMAQIGEFSFIMASLGVSAGAVDESFYTLVVAVSVVTAFTTPYLIRSGDTVAGAIERALPEAVLRPLHVYQSWLQALKWPLRNPRIPPALFPLVSRILVLVVLLLGAVGANLWSQHALQRLGLKRLLFEGDVRLLREVFFGFVYLVLFLLAVSTLRRLLRHFLKARGETMREKGRLLLNTLTFVASLLLGVLFLTVASPFVSAATILVVVGGVLLVFAGLLRRSLATVDTRFDMLVREVAASYGGFMPEARGSEEVGKLLRDHYPWDAEMLDFILPASYSAANQTLGDLKIRKKTGATVLAVYRGDAAFANPDPSFLFLPGDVLVLLGEKEHLAAAAEYLRELCRAPHPQARAESKGFHLDTVAVPEGSPLIGRTVAQAGVRSRTGASVVGLERRGERFLPPPPGFTLRAGDVLLLLGDPAEVENARRLIENPEKSVRLVEEAAVEQPEGEGEGDERREGAP